MLCEVVGHNHHQKAVRSWESYLKPWPVSTSIQQKEFHLPCVTQALNKQLLYKQMLIYWRIFVYWEVYKYEGMKLYSKGIKKILDNFY